MKKLLFAFLLLPILANAQLINTVAGNGSLVYTGDSAAATAASFYYPMGVAADAAGNIYISDAFNSVVRKVNPAGIITTIAGTGTAGFSGDDGYADTAQLNAPGALAVDAHGNLFIADVGNARIRRVSTFGTIVTVAGGGSSSSEGVPGTLYSLTGPLGIAFDVAGNMYISDDNRIHKISTLGYITTIAGNGAGDFGGDGGPATAAMFNSPEELAVDAAGNVYVADMYNFRVREVSASGVVSTIAGNGYGASSGYGGYAGDNGPANQAELNFPTGVAVGVDGSIYIADRNNNRIRMVNPSGSIVTVAGNGTPGFGGDGGPAADCQLSSPGSVALDRAGNLFIADELNNRIRKISGVAAGVHTLPPAESIQIYPNPATASFTVKGLESGDNILIHDLLGRELNEVTVNGNIVHIDISAISQGTYIVQVLAKNGQSKTRIRLVKI